MTIPATPMGPEQDEEVSHEYFPTCLCDNSTTVQMSIPPQYDLYKEREAVTNIFLNLYGMLSYIQALEVRINADSDSMELE